MLITDFPHLLVVVLTWIGTCTCNDQVWAEQRGSFFQFVIVNVACLLFYVLHTFKVNQHTGFNLYGIDSKKMEVAETLFLALM